MTTSNQTANINWTILFIAWLLVSVGVLGSLFFSEIMDFAPCELCWYQRIFLYPLVITLGLGFFPLDKGAIKYSLPLAALGWVVAFLHNLLYYRIIPEGIQPCRQGISCTEEYISLLGFITIPMLSLILFTAIIILLVTLKGRLP